MNGQAQREVSNQHCTPGSILAPVFFNILINILDDGAECTFSEFAADTNLKGLANMPEGYAAIQGDHNELEKWAGGKLVKFNKEKYKVLQLGRNNPIYLNRLRAIHIGSSLAERNLWVMVDNKVN